MNKTKKTFNKNFIIFLLIAIILLSTFVGILSYSPQKVNAEETEEEVITKAEDTITVKGTTYDASDEYFGIAKDYNDVVWMSTLSSVPKMSVVVKYDPTINQSIDLRYPDKYELYTKKYCGKAGCKKTYSLYVPFSCAELKLEIYKYDVTETSTRLGTHTLTYYKDGYWDKKYTPEKGYDNFSVDIRYYDFLTVNQVTGELYFDPFTLVNDYPCIEYLFEPDDECTNYLVKFTYDYKFECYTGSNSAWKHTHHWENHIRTYDTDKNVDYSLVSETGSLKSIFVNNIFPRYSSSETLLEDLKKDYGEYTAKFLYSIEESFYTKDITVGYLVPIDISDDVVVPDEYKEKEIPFAYLQTVNLTCRVTDGRILKSDFITAMKEAGYISNDYGAEFLMCFNSIVQMDEYIDQAPKREVIISRDYYEVSYISTYCIYLKSSSGNANNTILGLTNFYDYYHNFTIGSGSDYAILDQNFVDYMFSYIMKTYGLLNFKFKNKINSTGGSTSYKTLTASTLYGYWGFSFIPGGENLDGLLSKFIDGKKNSNGIAIIYSSECRLNGTALSSLRSDFGYSWLGGTIADVVGKFAGNSNNATFYAYYVAEITNDYVYVVSENDSLDLKDTSGLTEKTVKKGVSTLVKGVKTVFKKVGNIFKDPKKVLIIVGIVFLVVIFLWVCLKLFKNL